MSVDMMFMERASVRFVLQCSLGVKAWWADAFVQVGLALANHYAVNNAFFFFLLTWINM
jgi:hypothetical protein